MARKLSLGSLQEDIKILLSKISSKKKLTTASKKKITKENKDKKKITKEKKDKKKSKKQKGG